MTLIISKGNHSNHSYHSNQSNHSNHSNYSYWQVLTDLAQTEVACGEYREKWEQSEIHVKTLKQHKKSLELVGTVTHSNFVTELHDCWCDGYYDCFGNHC